MRGCLREALKVNKPCSLEQDFTSSFHTLVRVFPAHLFFIKQRHAHCPLHNSQRGANMQVPGQRQNMACGSSSSLPGRAGADGPARCLCGCDDQHSGLACHHLLYACWRDALPWAKRGSMSLSRLSMRFTSTLAGRGAARSPHAAPDQRRTSMRTGDSATSSAPTRWPDVVPGRARGRRRRASNAPGAPSRCRARRSALQTSASGPCARAGRCAAALRCWHATHSVFFRTQPPPARERPRCTTRPGQEGRARSSALADGPDSACWGAGLVGALKLYGTFNYERAASKRGAGLSAPAGPAGACV